MVLKTVVEVGEDCTFFNYGPPIQQKGVKFKGRTILKGTGVKMSPAFFLPGNNKGKVG